MSGRIQIGVVAGLCFLGARFSGAVLIVDDPFTDGGTGNGADALDIAWASNGGTGSFGIVDDSAGIGTGNALDRASTGTFVGIRGTFGTPVSINSAGDFISLQFDFRFTDVVGNNSSGFRFALGTTTSAYAFAIASGSSAAGNLFFNPNGSTGGAGQVGLADQNTTTYAVNDQLAHSAILTITRTATGIDVEASIDGVGSRIGSYADSGTGFFDTFERIYVGSGNLVLPYRVDNVQVNVVPEPGPIGLLALGACWLIRLRRRAR